jgi:enoyl-CoA hydratase/carnithine racemase
MAASTHEYLQTELRGGTLIVTINRPQTHNALTPDMGAALGAILGDYGQNDAALVAIITGAGERAFCGGFDLGYAAAHPEIFDQAMSFSEIVRRPTDLKPLIAAVNGDAFGLGFELALACDLIIAGANARFCLPEPKVGLAAIGGGVVRLTRQIGLKRAMGMLLTGTAVAAEEGQRLGFVNEVVLGEPVLDAALRWGELIARCAPLAIRATKQMAYDNFDRPDLQAALNPHGYPAVAKMLASADVREGARAFTERRVPRWLGR